MLVDHLPGDLELRIDAKAGNELLADRDQRQCHAADEILAHVHRRFAGQEHVVALVGQVRQAVDVRVSTGTAL